MSIIRNVAISDLESVNEIYNQAVMTKFSTAHTEPISMEQRLAWFGEHELDEFPVYVWEKNVRIAGWISFSPYRKGRKALQSTAEISYYVHNAFHRRGIGSELMEYAIMKAPQLNFKTLIAILLEPNTASIALLKKFGFEKWGDMPALAEIDGGEYNHQYYGLRINRKKT
ncbi:GNAT family N-acetyltransferase [Bacteroidota bacterium]